ncbi:hypothetical protein VKS41_007132 [Umbelopsis sp. WA50703]
MCALPVKIYYTFKGNATTCLCTFETSINNIKNEKWVDVPLKRCLLAVCSSCPDMLSGPTDDCAVYTASFEESDLSNMYNNSITANKSSSSSPVDKTIWEGHGLMSWILDDKSQHEAYATGKLGPSSGSYKHTVEVILQLQPSAKMSKSSFYENLSRDSRPPIAHLRSPPPSNARLAAPVPIHPHSSYSDERKHSDDQMLVRRYYEHRESPSMPLPSLSQSVPPYQPPPPLPHPHEPSPYYRGGLHDEKLERPRNHTVPHRDDNPYYDQTDRKSMRRSPPYQSDRMLHMASPRDRYGYNYPPPQESQQYDRLAWRDEGPWLRVSDNNTQHHQQPPPPPPPPSSSQHHHPTYSYSNEPPSHGHKGSLQSPSSGSAASSPPNEHHHLSNDQQDTRHPRLIRASGNAPADSKAPTYPFRLPLGKTVHHTRRKKRDTKPPNANELRTIVELEKDEHGNYKLPVEVDSWTVISLGKVIWDKPAFHNQRYIYPVGYVVKKWYRSMIDPHRDTQYICSILDGGNEPLFRLQADDNPKEVFQGQTPTSVWTIAVRRAFAVRNMEYGHNPVGPDFFGLRKNTIAKMIQDLPNADKCRNYVWQMFEIGRSKQGRGTKRPQATLADDVIHQHQFEQSVARGPIGRIRSVKLSSTDDAGDANSSGSYTIVDADMQEYHRGNEDEEEDDELEAED